MPRLTHSEAKARARLIRIVHTELDLDLTGDTDSFTSTSTIRFECRADGGTFVDLKAVRLERALLDGHSIDTATWADGRLPLPDLAAGSHELVTTATMAYASDGEGLHRHIAPDGQRYLYAMSFLDSGPKWFACFDQPDLKCPYTVNVTAPEDWIVRGNGPSEHLGETGQGSARWRLDQPVPLATYFVTLVAGPYAEVHDEHDGIRLGLCARADLVAELQEQAEDIFTVTKACFDAYHALFGVRYPFGDYHQAFVPDFNAGAMENPGCVTFRDQYLFRGAATQSEIGSRACTIAHEMAHMWFGDLVTLRWWDDLWLNESFAEFMAHLVCSRATPYHRWVDFGINRKEWGMVADQSRSTHPVAGNGAADAASALQQFDGISYAKGAAVLRQLALYLGEPAFQAGLRDYFDRYGTGNAAFADLLQCWESAGSAEVGEWAAAWLRTAGLDRLTGESETVGHATVLRSEPTESPGGRAHLTTLLRLAPDGEVLSEAPLRLVDAAATVNLPGQGGVIVPDGHDETWARIGLDWSSPVAIAGIADPRTRVVMFNALRDAVRHAELAPARAGELLVDALREEAEVEILTAMGRFLLEQLCEPYCPPQERENRRAAAAGMLTQVLADAEPGSDRQLAAFRLAVAATDNLSLLRTWLDDQLPEGLSPDRELRWQIARRLVSLTGETDVIEACLETDNSSAGQVHAARIRAGIPTREAKDAAFEILMCDTGAPAYEVYATAEGFFLSHQHELTAPYAVRYFAEIGETARFRTGWALGRVAGLAFPRIHVSEQTAAAAEVLVADPGTHPSIRRAVADELDKLLQALHASVLDK